ncbi:hypothetical protein J437_LFUL008122 [Ladona fulva]|uniref:Uncharacterized protein n=1 Tax=Ladona fulva TaxID=123851 RepID=A0A8K0NV21_LADFU|nr:hypothetical protein J437_LFUL008122 [Ladona fulva]
MEGIEGLIRSRRNGKLLFPLGKTCAMEENQRTTYDSVMEEGGLFREITDCFLKTKQEASGFPSWCQTLDKSK